MARDDQRGDQDRSREEAARKAGEKVSQDREHMSEIGRKGAEKRNRGR
jgi:general stress protein YciG